MKKSRQRNSSRPNFQKWHHWKTAAVVFSGAAMIAIAACSGGTSATDSGSTTTYDRAIDAYQTFVQSISTSFAGSNAGTCRQVSRDTSSCQAARTALGLSGDWLKFSCNVTLGLATAGGATTTTYSSAAYVTVTFYAIPDHTSNYFPNSGSYSFTANGMKVGGTYASMYSAYTTAYNDPNSIAQQSYVLSIPINPVSTTHANQGMGVIGVSVDGIPLYNNLAANTDNIFAEAGSFDTCQGHPSNEGGGNYHYHSEPYAISYQDSNTIGVMRDGYFIYGRYDNGSTTDINVSNTSSDAYIYGGHVGPVPSDTSTSRFHYHATKFTGCYHQSGSQHYVDDGDTTCTTGSGTLVTAYFLTGHGNGGVFATVPTGSQIIGGTTMNKNTAATRSYYGSVAGPCSGCN